MSLTKDLKERLSKIDNIREELKKAEKSASKDIMELLKTLMVDNPTLVAVKWQQYTPSFNDGSPCLFTMNGPFFKFDDETSKLLLGEKYAAGDDEADEDGEDGAGKGYIDQYSIDSKLEKGVDVLNFKVIATLQKAVKQVNAVYASLENMSGEMEEKFGDGMQIIVTKDGVETEDFDCGY